MNKNLVVTLIIYIFLFSIASAYQIPTENDYRYYNKGVYINMAKRQHKFYKSHAERNKDKDVYNHYYCLISSNNDIGYVLHRNGNTGGAVGYVTQTDGYMLLERLKCSAKYDTYPIVHSFNEAKNYQD